jgi:hypothetical protein
MRRRLVLAVEAFVPPTLAYVLALVLAPGRSALVTHVYLVVVVAGLLVGAALALGRALRAGPSPFESGLARGHRPALRVAQLERLEREVALARQSAWDVHYRLRPTLRATAAGLLSAGHGVDLERQPDRAAALLGADAWSLVRSDVAAPHDRRAPGVERAVLDRALSALEGL